MAGRRDPTDELMTYLETRLEADGLDYREAVMIEDLMASLSKLQGSAQEDGRVPGSAGTERSSNGPSLPVLKPKNPERF